MIKKSSVIRLMKRAAEVNRAIEAEVEDVLEDTENVIKECVPARDVRKTLTRIEEELANEGVDTEFDKKITRENLRKSAGEVLPEEEMEKLVKTIVEAVVDEIEEILEDADTVLDEDVKELKEEEKDIVESKLKSLVESKLAEKSIKAKFARNFQKVTKQDSETDEVEGAEKTKTASKETLKKITAQDVLRKIK
jgi:hypothetical protein